MGYRYYDCVPASPGGLSVGDVTMTAALDSRVSGAAVLGVMTVAPEVSEALDNIPTWQTFWQLAHDDVVTPPAEGTTAWWVWRAWHVLFGVPEVGVAVCNKVLHHKRPWLFPLLDGVTVQAYPELLAWAGVHEELTEQRDAFDELESWFAGFAKARDGVPVTRLRLHDILLWCGRIERERREAYELGLPLLNERRRYTAGRHAFESRPTVLAMEPVAANPRYVDHLPNERNRYAVEHSDRGTVVHCAEEGCTWNEAATEMFGGRLELPARSSR